MKNSLIKSKSYEFALEIIAVCRDLNEQKEFALSNQLIRSGTAIGALIMEAEFAQSSADFVHKLSIALKEANETKYWLSLLKDSKIISNEVFDEILPQCSSLVGLLVTSIKTAKGKLERKK